MPRTIVVPLAHPSQDPEGVSLAAVPYAQALAARTGATVKLVTAINAVPTFNPLTRSLAPPSDAAQDQLAEEATAILARIGDQLPGHRVETDVRWGSPVEAILRVLADAEDPVLVLASRNRKGFPRLIHGSVAFGLVHEASCPVLIVRGPASEDTAAKAPALTKVLVPLDRSPFAEQALGSALAALDGADVQVHLVHVIEAFDYPELPAHTLDFVARPIAEEYLNGIAHRLVETGYRVTTEVRAGKPPDEISVAVAEHGVDLIAMATHGRSGFTRFVYGSTAESMLREARVPLLLVRPDEASIETARRQAAEGVERGPASKGMPPAILGRRAGEIMTSPAVVAREDTPVAEVAELMLSRRIGCVPIVDQAGVVTGIVTESDFVGDGLRVPLAAYQVHQFTKESFSEEELRRVYAAGQETTAGQIMRRPVVTVTEDDPIGVVAAKLVESDVNRVPVVRDGVPIGVIAQHDLIKLLLPGRA